MPIKFIRQGDMWTAEVTPPHGQWRSFRPKGIGYLIEELRSSGLQQDVIDRALQEAAMDMAKPMDHWADRILPTLKAALAGEYEVPPQQPFVEAWLAYALFLWTEPHSMTDIVDNADFIDRATPTPDEVAWAFVRLRARGWLTQQEDLYGLTAEGRQVIEGLLSGETVILGALRRLEEWVRIHPPPGSD